MPMLKKDKEKLEAARLEWEKKFKAIFFHTSPSLVQDFMIVKLCTLREYAVDKLKDIINDVKNELVPLNDKSIYDTFVLFNRVRNCTLDVVEGIAKWQQAFTYVFNPPLMQCDYIMERLVKHITFVNSTSLRRPYNFQFAHRGNFLMLPFPNPRTIQPIKVSKELFKEIQDFAYPDEEKIVRCYKALVNCLPDEDFAKLMPLEQWLKDMWNPCVYIPPPVKEKPKKEPKFKINADGTIQKVEKKKKKVERIDNGPFYSAGLYKNDELPRLISADESQDMAFSTVPLEKRPRSVSPGKRNAPSSLASSRSPSRSPSPILKSKSASGLRTKVGGTAISTSQKEELLAELDLNGDIDDLAKTVRITDDDLTSTNASDKLPAIVSSDSPVKSILKSKKGKDKTDTTSSSITATSISAADNPLSPLKAPKAVMKFLLQLPYDSKTDCVSPDLKFKFEDEKKTKVEEVIPSPVKPKESLEDEEEVDGKKMFSLGVIKAVSLSKEAPKRRKKAKNENPDGTAKYLNPFFEVRKKTEMFSGSREKEAELLTIEEKAKRMSFSTVAIRNWVQNSE